MRTLTAASLLLALCSQTRAQTCFDVTELCSRATSGAPGNALSQAPRLSAGGRWVAFATDATNLGGDGNGFRDVYRHDRQTGATVMVSVTDSGVQGNGDSDIPSISDDGRFVAFESTATNLVPGDTNGVSDVFVADLATGAIERVSVSSLGNQADGGAWNPVIAGDGGSVAFHSSATNLLDFVPDTNGSVDVWIHDRTSAVTRLASATSTGGFATGSSYLRDVSADGRWVTFESPAADLVPLDTNGFSDVFLRDVTGSATYRVSLGALLVPGIWREGNEDSGGGSVSDDGRWVAFSTRADNLVAASDTNGTWDVLLRDRQTGTTSLVSVATGAAAATGNGPSRQPRLSGDGSVVAFTSWASDLVAGDSNGVQDAFVRDLAAGATTRASLSNVANLQGGASSYNVDLSRDGQWVAFQSAWGAFTAIDGNGVDDVFVRGRDCTFPTVYCTAKTTSNGCVPRISWVGEAKADLSGGFRIRCIQTINNKPGILFYGVNGRAALPFQGGLLCVQPPTKRGPVVFSGGAPPPDDCTGAYDLDMDAYAGGALGGSPLPALQVAGTLVNAQWWGRDPGWPFPQDTVLSDAIEYTVRP